MRLPSALLLLSLFGATAAFAGRTRVLPIVVGVDDPSRAAALAQHAELLEKLRTADDRIEVVDSDEIVEKQAADLRTKNLEAGKIALRKAEAARKADGAEEAKAGYDDAHKALEASDWRVGFESLVTALAWSAALSKSADDMRLVFTLRPDWQFPAGAISPSNEAWVAEQRAAKQKATRVAFEVKSEVPAAVWVDGVFRGVTPVSVTDVVAGRHLLTAMSPGYALLQREELVSGGSVVQLAMEDTAQGVGFRASLEAVRGGFRSGEYLIPVKTLVETSKVPEAVVVAIRKAERGFSILVIRMNQGGQASTAEKPIKSASDAAAGVTGLVRGLYDQPIGVALDENGAVQSGLSRRTGSYVAWGAGGAALVTGIILAGVAQAGYDAAQKIPSTDTASYDLAISKTRPIAYTSYALFGLAAVGAGVGTWLFLTSSPQPTRPVAPPQKESDPFTWNVGVTPGAVTVSGTF